LSKIQRYVFPCNRKKECEKSTNQHSQMLVTSTLPNRHSLPASAGFSIGCFVFVFVFSHFVLVYSMFRMLPSFVALLADRTCQRRRPSNPDNTSPEVAAVTHSICLIIPRYSEKMRCIATSSYHPCADKVLKTQQIWPWPPNHFRFRSFTNREDYCASSLCALSVFLVVIMWH